MANPLLGAMEAKNCGGELVPQMSFSGVSCDLQRDSQACPHNHGFALGWVQTPGLRDIALFFCCSQKHSKNASQREGGMKKLLFDWFYLKFQLKSCFIYLRNIPDFHYTAPENCCYTLRAP